MSAIPFYAIECDWPECKEHFDTDYDNASEARRDARLIADFGIGRQPDEAGQRRNRDYCAHHMEHSKRNKNPDDWRTA